MLALGIKALAEQVGIAIATALFALVGTASTEASLSLERHWRDLRIHSVHNAHDLRFAKLF